MLRSLVCSILLVAILPGQVAPRPLPTDPEPAALRVEVPTFGNQTCPIMGKKVSMPLFIDTELGRFYVCCKPCYKKVLRDLPLAHKTAYPAVQDLKNTTCPVSGQPIGEDAVEVTLQGYRVKLCCAGCIQTSRTHSQVTLTKATRPQAVDVGNTLCPLSGKPVVANAFVLVGDDLVHLAAPTPADEVNDPAALLAKARALTKGQPPRPPHVHEKGKAPAAAPAPTDAGKEQGK